MSSTVNLYKYYCIEEGITHEVWGTTPPTECLDPSAHTDRSINPESVVVIQTISQNTVIAEEASEGWYNSSMIMMDVPTSTPGTVHIQDVSWTADILLWRTTIFTDGDTSLDGDIFSIVSAPNTPVGYIVAAATATSTSVTVSSTVLQYVTRGIDISIKDSSNNIQELGLITAIDKTASTVTFQNPLTATFGIGSIILLNVHTIKDMTVSHMVKTYDFGLKGMRGKKVPANTILRMYYTSNSGLATKVAIKIECYIMG